MIDVADENMPLTIKQYAKVVGRPYRSVYREAKDGRIPTWKDPTMPRSPMVTSIAAVNAVRDAQQEKALKAFKQKAKL